MESLRGSFVFLGTGSSSGVPLIGCTCAICTSSSPYNKRMRPAGLLKIGDLRILIDVGPDFRQQALRFGIQKRLDGVLLTHTHYDHIAGIDDLRVFFLWGKVFIPFLVSKESGEELHKRYEYLFQPPKPGGSRTAKIQLQFLEGDHGDTEFLGLPIRYVSFSQGGMKVTGFRIGDFAYISDIHDYEESIFASLKGVKTLVLSALLAERSPLHLSLDEAVGFARKVGAKKTYLTHMAHALDHEETNRTLPSDVQLGYDGLELNF